MKLYLKVVAALLFSGAWIGLLVPGLVSADDDVLVVTGVVAALAYPLLLYIWFKAEITRIKEKLNA